MSNDANIRRCRTLRNAVILLMLALAGYVGWLQLVRSHELSKWSQRQQTRSTYVPGRRGSIMDRNGTLLNYDLPRYAIALHIEQLRDPRDTRNTTVNKVSATIASLATTLGSDTYLTRPTKNDILRHLSQNAPLPLILWRDPSPAIISKFATNKHLFPAAELVLSWHRVYDHPDTATQLRGYGTMDVPPQSRESTLQLNFKEYVGKTGLELALNSSLRGTNGYQLMQTDVFTYRHETVKTQRAMPGTDIALTIDLKLQQIAENAFRWRGLRGALVLMDATNGEILVMASVPSYHLPPQKSDSKQSGAYINRAISGFYPPGSTIKPLIALAALQNQLVTPDELIRCDGSYLLTSRKRVACTARYGHGSLSLVPALAASCNVYFCVLGTRLERTHLAELAGYVGLGKKLNTVLWRDELAGVAFTPEWVQSSRSQDPVWHPGDAVNSGIGQGGWIVTPLQMAVYTCAITCGRVFTPKFTISTDNALVDTLSWPDEIWQPVKEGMRECVSAPVGTGKQLRITGVDILAKTGTAEHNSKEKPHAWTIAALPGDSPKLIGVCVVECGGGGGKVAAPILRELLIPALELL